MERVPTRKKDRVWVRCWVSLGVNIIRLIGLAVGLGLAVFVWHSTVTVHRNAGQVVRYPHDYRNNGFT